MRTVALGTCVSLTLLCLAATAPPAAAFHVTYNYYCYATNSDGIPVTDEATLVGQWYTDGTYSKTGEYGNYGSCTLRADISTATISVNAHSHGVQTGPFTFPSGTGRVETCLWRDELTFIVLAGTYPDGVHVTIWGRALGTISSDVGAGAMVRVYATLGGQTYDTGLLEVGVAESGSVDVNEIFALTQEIVAPGATLNQTTEYSNLVSLAIHSGQTWSTYYNPGGGSVIGDGDIGFYNGVQLVAMRVSPGVSWTSESGVFPFLPTAVVDDPTIARAPQLRQNHPNPFNPATTIRYVLPSPAKVDLRVFDAAGRLVASLLNDTVQDAGVNEVVWRGADDRGRPLASGVYHYRLETEGYVQTKRMVLLR